jgi:hypothetical protein
MRFNNFWLALRCECIVGKFGEGRSGCIEVHIYFMIEFLGGN